MKLTIKRSGWLRGEGSGNSYLLREQDGKMCCLGFLACALSASQEDIRNKPAPSCAPHINWPKGFISTHLTTGDFFDTSSNLMSVNDNKSLSEDEREGMLTESLKLFNIEVEFVD